MFYSTAAASTFYVGSAFAAFNSPQYHDFFIENVPLATSFLQYAEDNEWDTLTLEKVITFSSKGVTYVQGLFSGEQGGKAIEKTKEAVERSKEASKERIQAVKHTVKTTVSKATGAAAEQTSKEVAIAKHQAAQFSEGVDDLVRRAEAALAGNVVVPKPDVTTTPDQPEVTPPDSTPAAAPSTSAKGKNVYDAPLPLGFEPPPGYSKPAPPKKAPVKEEAKPVAIPELPLVAPAVAEFAASEPIISQLASVIDDLASYLRSNPAAAEKARDVLDTAKVDLTQLASRIEQVKEEERQSLEAKLDEQTRDYTIKLLEMEMEAQDRLDNQEEGFRKFFDDEKTKFVQAYREKLNRELQTQSEIINERYVNMTWSMSCVLMMYLQLEGGGHRPGY